MRLFNSLSKKIEELKPLEAGKVGLYSCGPTVYDHIHIGNLSSFTFADTLRRVLTTSGLSVEHVMNFTDIDDKTIRSSKLLHPELDAKVALSKLTDKYSKIFLEDMKLIGNDIGLMTFIKATASIEDIKKLISQLVDSGFAYVTNDGVYFSISKYKASGKTYGQLVDISSDLSSEARIDNDEYDKESAHDFALWKKQKDGEPAWEFSIGGKDLSGRPGWHIECSVMSKKCLGQPFDIHTGGIDLAFPHHENEIAQSTANEDNPLLATYFTHNEHLLIDGKKMSKSLKNFYTLEDITKKGFEPLSLRLMFLQAHYRKQMNFTWENLQAAANRLSNLRAFADLRFQPQTAGVDKDEIEIAKKQMQTALENDLSTPEALAKLSGLVGAAEVGGVAEEATDTFKGFTQWLDEVFGLSLSSSNDIDDKQKQLIKQRLEARKQKDFKKSDELREELKKQGIAIRDVAGGQVWNRLV